MSRRKAFTSSSTLPSTTSTPATITPPDPDHASITVPTETTAEKQAHETQSVPPTPPEIDEDAQCFICAEPITFWSIGICGHRTCHVCAVRLRTFYKKDDCTFCKTPLPSLLFSRSPATPFPTEHHIKPSPAKDIAAAQAKIDTLKKGEKWYAGLTMPGMLDLDKFPHSDEHLKVVFEDEDMMEETLMLLRYNCPYQDCPFQGNTWTSLERHTLSTHGLSICYLCRSQLSRFAHEQVLYPPHLLPLHDPSKVKPGQRPPRPRGEKEIELVKSWEAAHPMCEFCHQAFFGPDELFKHMRESHEMCHVCKDLGIRDVYFENYPKLEKHFGQDHFACRQPECLEKKFVVFGTDLDLRAHMMSEHSGNMSARDRAQARQLPVDFSDEPRRSGPNRVQGSRGFTLASANDQPGPSRGRDAPHHQRLDGPSLTPDQAAQQERQKKTDRQEENKRRKAFASGLSSSNRQENAGPSRSTANEADAGLGVAGEEVDEAMMIRHAELLSRVSMLTSDSPTKLSSFRYAVRQFKGNESSAKHMIDTIFNVFDQDADTTVGIVREIATLFNGEGEGDKQRAVLEAINAFRVEQREQFPSLGSAPTGQGTNWAGVSSGRILNAKRTTQTGRPGQSQAVWDRVEAAAASHPVNKPRTNPTGRYVPGSGVPLQSTSVFPSLGAGTSRSAGHSTPWAGGGAGSGSKTVPALTGPIVRSVNYPVAPTKTKPLNTSAFPSLPTTSKQATTAAERKALFTKPSIRERIAGPGPSAQPPIPNGWGVTSGVDALSIADEDAQASNGNGNGNSGGGGKKKGKQKQLLFSVSARPS